jgi:hypothetical protein
VVHRKSWKVDVYTSYYLSEPFAKMPYMRWETELKPDRQALFESAGWNKEDLFLDYFETCWDMEKQDLQADESKDGSFIYAPGSARDKCLSLQPDA